MHSKMHSNPTARAASAVMVVTALLLGACGSSGGKQLSTKDFCKEVSQSSKENKAIAKAFAKAKTLGDIRSAVSKSSDRINKLADEAPGKIKGDVQTVADSLGKLSDAAKKAKSLPDFSKRAAKVTGDKDTVAAGKRLDAWQKKNCKKKR